MTNSSQSFYLLEALPSREEINAFILSIISSSPGFDYLGPNTATSTSTSSGSTTIYSISVDSEDSSFKEEDLSTIRKRQALAKAYTIIGLMRTRGFRPITADEYIEELRSLNFLDTGIPIFIWRPYQIFDEDSS